jgi:hypothetical protein
MAGTMVEDGFSVKAPPACAAVASDASGQGERFGAAKARPAPEARSVNASLTRPSHCRCRDPKSRAFWPVWGDFMRFVIAAAALVLFGTAAAQAEKRVFIIANNSDGYGVDRCLASGAECGTAVANSYCKSREFAQALSFSKVDRDDITGAIPSSGPGSCHGATCDNFVAIVCSR